MSTTTTPLDITIGHNVNTDEEITLSHLEYHTAAFGSKATRKSTHQHNIMQQLAENGTGFCYMNTQTETIDTLLERLPHQSPDDVLHIDDNSQLYTLDELEHAIENNNIILVENSMLADEKQQQQFFTEFLTDYWNTIQENESTEHAIFIDRFHQLAHTDRFDYPSFLTQARRYNLTVHINAIVPHDLPQPLRDTVFANCGNLLIHRTLLADDAEDLAKHFDTVTATDLSTLDQHNAYIRTADTPGDVVETALLTPGSK